VALALFASCPIATLVAMALPWLFQRLGADPAFGSGPLATVIQDLLWIAVYLAIRDPASDLSGPRVSRPDEPAALLPTRSVKTPDGRLSRRD